MTVASTPRKAGPFTGNGINTTFNFTFKVFTASEVAVTKADIYGNETQLVLNSDYSVAVNEDQNVSPGGTVTYPIAGDPLATGEGLVLVGGLVYNQTTSLPNGGAYNATTVERALDRIVMLAQQLLEVTSRGVTLALTAASNVSARLPSPVAGAFIAWNGTATALVNAAGMASVAVSSFMATVVGAADAAAARLALGAAKSGANTDITSLSNITSLSSPALGSATATTQTAGDNSTKVATTAYADTSASQHKFSAYQALTASGSISAGTIGGLVLIDAASATVAMPALPAAYKTVTIWNGMYSVATTLTTPGTELFIATGHWGTATMTLQPGEGLTLMSDGTNWVQAGSGPSVTGIGAAQTWQNVVGSRAYSTTYYNTTGRPIMVNTSCSGSTGSSTSTLIVDGVTVSTMSISSGISLGVSHTAIVPPGSSYSATSNSGLASWLELR
jgi:hypothetical protein